MILPLWKLKNTHVWSSTRPVETLRNVLSIADEPISWRRLVSWPGGFVAFVRYETREKR